MAAGAAKRGALICSFLALALSAGGAPAADTAPDADASCGADCLARMLVERIPAGETVALIPFGPPRTGIPESVAKELQDAIQRALASASAGRHDFISRDLFDEKWRGWQGADFEAFLARQHIDVAVLCEDRAPRGAEVRLSCTAHAAGEESALAGDVPGPDTAFPVAEPFFRYAYTVSRLAHRLAAAAAAAAPAPGVLVGAFVAERTSGQRSPLSEDIENRALAIVEDRLAARRVALLGSAEVQDALTGAAGAAGAGVEGAVAWELRGDVAWTGGSAATMRLRLREAGEAGGRVAREEAALDRAWLPSYLLPAPGPRRHRAAGRAVESAGFGAAAAPRAALDLARARLVSGALGHAAPDIDSARSEADGVAALSWLEWGVPADERIEGPRESAPGVWDVALEASVVAVGSAVRPRFAAQLEQDEFRAGERLRVELTAEERVYAAAFAWGADGKVWRLFPNAVDREAAIPAGGRVVAPDPDRCPVTVGPLPGARSSREAVVAVASAAQLAFEDLAPPACHDGAGPTPVAVPAGAFLAALAGLGLERAAIAVLPYRVAE